MNAFPITNEHWAGNLMKEESRGWRGGGGRSKKEIPKRISTPGADVLGQGYWVREKEEKMDWGFGFLSLHMTGRRDCRLVLSSEDRNEASCRRMNGAWKGKFYSDAWGSLTYSAEGEVSTLWDRMLSCQVGGFWQGIENILGKMIMDRNYFGSHRRKLC